MIYELRQRSLAVVAEQIVPLNYKGVVVEGAYRLDLLVGDSVVVEIKAVEATLPVHYAQVLSYLRLTNKPIGLLINFNVPVLVKGIKRIMQWQQHSGPQHEKAGPAFLRKRNSVRLRAPASPC